MPLTVNIQCGSDAPMLPSVTSPNYRKCQMSTSILSSFNDNVSKEVNYKILLVCVILILIFLSLLLHYIELLHNK